jgi:hypothetical protein
MIKFSNFNFQSWEMFVILISGKGDHLPQDAADSQRITNSGGKNLESKIICSNCIHFLSDDCFGR